MSKVGVTLGGCGSVHFVELRLERFCNCDIPRPVGEGIEVEDGGECRKRGERMGG